MNEKHTHITAVFKKKTTSATLRASQTGRALICAPSCSEHVYEINSVNFISSSAVLKPLLRGAVGRVEITVVKHRKKVEKKKKKQNTKQPSWPREQRRALCSTLDWLFSTMTSGAFSKQPDARARPRASLCKVNTWWSTGASSRGTLQSRDSLQPAS